MAHFPEAQLHRTVEFYPQKGGTILISELTLCLVLLALAEGCLLMRKQSAQLCWKESFASYFILLAKPYFYLACRAILSRSVLTIGLLGHLLVWAWPHRFFTIPNNTVWAPVLLFFLVDFLYYWEHRLKHTIRWFWANHAVHHASQKINLSAGLRLGWTGAISTNLAFYTPLVLLGYRPRDVLFMMTAQQIYQLATHTALIDKLGWLESFAFVTPSHHRVHHGINERYLNKNFGGVLIVFDKIFGTFEEEKEPCVFGLVQQLESKNPFRILTVGWFPILQDLPKVRSVRGLFDCLFQRIDQPDKLIHNKVE